RDQCQSEPGAAFSGLAATTESFEHQFAFVDRQSAAVVVDGDDNRAVAAPVGVYGGLGGAAVFHRIRQRVVQCQPQSGGQAAGHQVGVGVDAHGQTGEVAHGVVGGLIAQLAHVGVHVVAV